MEPNLHQLFSTPAASKNKIYFMWDFIARTMSMLSDVEPSLQRMGKEEEEAWTDVIGRSVMAQQLILDTKPGMLDLMVSATYPGQAGPTPQFGDEIVALARQLTAS
ncbi:MAG: hypothetical protein M1821_003552 [Bathelium mastoideum]|nr:MAG: hypothetical protein M1821_003552 [Bathelium mastoideum]KAI9682638.1 MAG: hypothetical protein M1822_006936 [Bathelium mastoideum]